jgi:hypothetical protein
MSENYQFSLYPKNIIGSIIDGSKLDLKELLNFQIPTWARLEPHSRNSDLEDGIRATIHDPAWLLSRQWTLGEFEGEDASSVVYAKIKEKNDKISKIIIKDQVIPYNPEIPLEVYIEKTSPEVPTYNSINSKTFELTFKSRVKLGLQFYKEIQHNLDNSLSSNEISSLKYFMASHQELNFNLNSHQMESEPEITKEYLNLIKGRVIDIYKIKSKNYSDIFRLIVDEHFSTMEEGVRSNISNSLKVSTENVFKWWDGNNDEDPFFEIPNEEDLSAWNSRSLEYEFKVQIGETDSNNILCSVDDYKEDFLSWYSFRIEQETRGYDLNPASENTRVLIAKHLKIPGQPEKRYWNFEDSKVDFGLVKPNITNIITLLLMEFSFVHSADWYIIPFTMKIGSISEIQEFTIVDTFGDEIIITPAGKTPQEIDILDSDLSWDSWSPFTLSKKFQSDLRSNTNKLFLPPVINDLKIGPYHEEIKFLRDEVANLTWAVEKSFRTLLGESINGYDYYQYKRNLITPVDPINSSIEKAIEFKFKNVIPWNWIPFIPVHEHNFSNLNFPDHSQVVYQRGAMINHFTNPAIPIKPNSRLLNEVSSPYFIDESIIPRTGVIYSERFQRTVWMNGKTFLWIGRKKMFGSHEGYSGLRFDQIDIN